MSQQAEVAMTKNNSAQGYGLALVLSTVYFMAMLDRQVLSILFDPIKADLDLSDTQLAMLSGIAFSLFYSLAGIPLGRLADRTHRVNMLSRCMIVWSMFTSLGGLAQSYSVLLLARIGVGIGEGGCSPAAHSIISDSYPPERRSRAIAIYTFGGALGGATAYLVGGWLVELFGWRLTMISVGLPGLLLAVVLKLLVKEPPRVGESSASSASNASLMLVLRSLLGNRVYVLAVTGHVLAVGYLFVIATWLPSYINRNFEVSYGELGTLLFGVTLAAAIVGNLGSGWLTDSLFKQSPKWLARGPAIAMLFAGPSAIMAFSSTQIWPLVVFLTLTKALLYANLAPSFAAVHYVITSRQRGVAVALKILLVSIVGVGLFPVLIGLISDTFTASYGNDALRYGVIAFSALCPISSMLYLVMGSSIPDKSVDEVVEPA